MSRLAGGSVRRARMRVCGDVIARDEDDLAAEVPLAFVINGEPFAVMMATPCDLEDFALGFCLSEAMIERAAELDGVEVQPRLEGMELRLRVADVRAQTLRQRARGLEGRSGCGVCGAQTLEQVLRVPPAVGLDDMRLAGDSIRIALARLRDAQPLNALTGATHAAAWCGLDGGLRLVREDVGRHNALDKLIGAVVRGGQTFADGFVLLTSRASYEMVMKSATVGVGIVVAISAPTSLAVLLAEQCGVTLIGFARGDEFVLYSHPARLLLGGGSAGAHGFSK